MNWGRLLITTTAVIAVGAFLWQPPVIVGAALYYTATEPGLTLWQRLDVAWSLRNPLLCTYRDVARFEEEYRRIAPGQSYMSCTLAIGRFAAWDLVDGSRDILLGDCTTTPTPHTSGFVNIGNRWCWWRDTGEQAVCPPPPTICQPATGRSGL